MRVFSTFSMLPNFHLLSLPLRTHIDFSLCVHPYATLIYSNELFTGGNCFVTLTFIFGKVGFGA